MQQLTDWTSNRHMFLWGASFRLKANQAGAPKKPNAEQKETLAAGALEAERDLWLTPMERMRPGDMEPAKSGGEDAEPGESAAGWGIERSGSICCWWTRPDAGCGRASAVRLAKRRS